MYLLGWVLKQARRWFVFPREFSSLFRVSRVQLRRCSGNSAGLLRCRVTSPGKLSSATVGFVAPLRLWHGLRPPPMVGFVERESDGPASRSALRAFERAEFRSARELQEGREERARRSRVVFSTVRFGRRPPAADRIRLSVWGGAPPMSMVFLQGIFDGEKNNF